MAYINKSGEAFRTKRDALLHIHDNNLDPNKGPYSLDHFITKYGRAEGPRLFDASPKWLQPFGYVFTTGYTGKFVDIQLYK